MNLFNDNERETLSKAIETRLISLWKDADRLPSGSIAYSTIVDEVLELRAICLKFNIKLDDSVESRF